MLSQSNNGSAEKISVVQLNTVFQHMCHTRVLHAFCHLIGGAQKSDPTQNHYSSYAKPFSSHGIVQSRGRDWHTRLAESESGTYCHISWISELGGPTRLLVCALSIYGTVLLLRLLPLPVSSKHTLIPNGEHTQKHIFLEQKTTDHMTWSITS